MYLLENDGRPLAAGQRLDDVFPHLEEVGEAAVRALPEPRLVKTHLPFARTPWSAQAKYIYVARNPFDCAVSFYHHTRGFERHYDFAEGTWDLSSSASCEARSISATTSTISCRGGRGARSRTCCF